MKTQRLDSTITNERLREALLIALASVNDDLGNGWSRKTVAQPALWKTTPNGWTAKALTCSYRYAVVPA